jgi:3-hydroxybutyryl-CoA dehydrogenase
MSPKYIPSDPSRALTRDAVVGIVGAGTMGSGIGQVAALAGHHVILFDADAAISLKAVVAIRQRVMALSEKGRFSQEGAAKICKNIKHVSAINDLADASLIIEAVVEDVEIKFGLFKSLEAVVGESCILATNTSSISINRLASKLHMPGRLIGMHFFNPVYAMQLVEVVVGFSTDPAIADSIFETAKAWGKIPIYAESSPGFVVNRIARPYYAEALNLLTEKAASPATLDAIMRDCGGFRMGPFELIDLIGLDVNLAVTQSVYEAYFFDARYRPSTLQREMVNAGFLGRKSGRGFYLYNEGVDARTPDSAELQHDRPAEIKIDQTSAFGRALMGRLPTDFSFLPLASQTDGRIAEIEDAVVYQSDGRTATRRGFDNSIENTVLIDLAFNYQTTPRLAVTHSDMCSAKSFNSVLAVLQGGGYLVSKIDDVAGMVLIRTLSMLANEASDAVSQGICTAEAADIAMKLGMNYPIGPLSWAESVGYSRIWAVLDHLTGQYGGERYRVSPALQRLSMRSMQMGTISSTMHEHGSASMPIT